jgi:hypothetical protein
LQGARDSASTRESWATGAHPLHCRLTFLGGESKRGEIHLLPRDEVHISLNPRARTANTPLTNTAITIEDDMCARHIPIVGQYLRYDQSL